MDSDYAIHIEEDPRFYWRENNFLPIPKPGDKVKIRTWEDMEKQCGLNSRGDIPCVYFNVTKEMKSFCGRTITVKCCNDQVFTILEENEDDYAFWSIAAIEEVYPKEEKMEFTKDMLKNGEHVVELRDGDGLLYLNGRLVGREAGTDIRFYSSDLRNTGCERDKLDIMAVYKAKAGNTLNIILSCSKDLIWKREEPIEISASEAFAKLKEIYGKEVKIVKDKDE